MSLSKPISAIMSSNPVVATASNKFSQVLRLFSEFPVHHLPIVDDNNKLIGIISSNDLYKIFLNLSSQPQKITIDMDSLDKAVNLKDIMTANPVTIAPDETIGNAIRIFAEKKFLSLPVVDKSGLIGILSLRDVMGYVAQNVL